MNPGTGGVAPGGAQGQVLGAATGPADAAAIEQEIIALQIQLIDLLNQQVTGIQQQIIQVLAQLIANLQAQINALAP